MNSNGSGRNHAVVLGGSMAGLLAARVLADHYKMVTIVDRDTFPAVGEQRRGVPQGRHTHGLLAGGRRILEGFFPGLSNALSQAGAISGDLVRDGRWFHEGACLSRFTSGLDGLMMSRPLLEGTVRDRLLKFENVRVRENCEVQGLVTADGQSRVVGVRLQDEVVTADLVVDATGKGSHSPQWLESLGYPKPAEDRVEIALGYTTRCFRRQSHELNGDVAAIIPPTKHGKVGGVILAQEGNRWTVTLIAHFGKSAPSDLPGFIEFARNLPAPYIYEVIRNAEPLGDPAVARFPASMRRRYENLSKFPEGYLVFGDAISSFNPIYGQGMSASAFQAVELGKELVSRADHTLSKRFFTRAAKVTDIPWSIAVGNDLRMPETTGPRTAGVRFINWYMAQLHKAAHHDDVATLAFHKVANLLAPPSSVMHPRVALRILWRNLFSKRAASPMHSAARAAASTAGQM